MNKLDLHGIKHQDVQRKLDIFFWQMIQKKINNVEVVTGISITMKEIVKNTCNDYGYKVYEPIFNPGCLLVEM